MLAPNDNDVNVLKRVILVVTYHWCQALIGETLCWFSRVPYHLIDEYDLKKV